MKKLLYYFCLVLCLFYWQMVDVIGQSGAPQQIIMPIQMSEKRQGKTYQEQVSFLMYPYHGEKVDLRDFKQQMNLPNAPDYLDIEAPSTANPQQTTVLIGKLSGTGKNEQNIVIWLANNYETNEVTFFFDKNRNLNFREKGEYLTLNSKDKPCQVVIGKEDSPAKYELWVKVPKKKIVQPAFQHKNRILYRFVVAANLSLSGNNLEYSYQNLEKGFPTWYNVRSAGKGVGLSLSYYHRYFRLSLEGNYQNMYYYASYLNVRFAEPEVLSTPQGIVRRENVGVEQNKDKHTRHHLSYSATIAPRILINPSLELQPFVGVGQLNYQSNTYEANRFDSAENYDLPNGWYLKAGVRFELLAIKNQNVYVDFGYQQHEWLPSAFFNAIPHERLETKYAGWLLHIGYSKAL